MRNSSAVTEDGDKREAQAFSIRLWLTCLAGQELLCVYLGIRLGLYDSLARSGPVTEQQLAAQANIAPRYAREWLEQQAVAGIIKVDAPAKNADQRRYWLSPAHREVLTSSDSPLSRVASVLPVGGVAMALPELLAAYRSGNGVPDSSFGADWREGHAQANRALFLRYLPGWLRAAVPDVHVRLGSGPARVADIACGAGWAGIGLAQAYPELEIHGFDIDPLLIAEANKNAAEAGLQERVKFEVRDAATVRGQYAAVCLFDALHELPNPVEILKTCRALRAPRDCVLVMDARVERSFSAPAGEVERFQYTTSVLHCLPACMSERPSAGTGTVMRIESVREFSRDAGFSQFDVLSIDDRFHNLYRLSG